MNTFSMTVLAALLIGAAAYAQARIPRHTAGRRNVLLTRTVLIAVGLVLGYVSARLYGNDGFTALLAFVSGFGAVHVPAAFILLIKWGRGAGPT